MKPLALLFLISFSLQAQEATKLLLKTEILPQNFSWADLKLIKGESFTGPVEDAWLEYVKSKAPSPGTAPELCRGACEVYEREWLTKPAKDLVVPPEYAKAVWLKVYLSIWKVNSEFHWEGRAVLLDNDSKRTLASLPLSEVRRKFTETAQDKFNSQLANQIYRTPLTQLAQLVSSLSKVKATNKTVLIRLKGHRNSVDAYELSAFIQTRGEHLGLVATVKSIGKNEAIIQCQYAGDGPAQEKSFTDLLSHVKELKSQYVLELITE